MYAIKKLVMFPQEEQQQQSSSSAFHSTNQQQYLTDLEKIGIDTSNNLRELLTTCPDPVEGIRTFQLNNSVQLPSLSPIMKLLDLHGIRRTEYHESVIAELSDKMLAKLRALGEKQTPENVHKLEQHLERCFRLYRVPKFRPIVLETLAQLPKVADRYLKLIICDKEFYDQCSVSVKQQIWIKNESLFLEAVEPVLDAYIHGKEQLLLATGVFGTERPTNFFTVDSWKGRRQKKFIQELISMVGQRELLYIRLTDIIRERFLSTGNSNYCSLRFELLMAAHDVNVDFLVRVDPCHDFAWCLDACAKHHRAKLIETQQMSKLKTLLDTGKKGQNKNIAEMSLIAGDPHILHMIASSAIKTIRDNASSSNSVKPRDLGSLQLMLKILLMGLHAKELLMDDKAIQQLLNAEIFTVFLAAFTTMMVQDVIRNELAAAPEEVSELFAIEKEIQARPVSIDHFLHSQPVCSLLWLHFLAIVGDALPSNSSKRRPIDSSAILRYLDILPHLVNQMALKDQSWAHLLTHRLLNCPSLFSSEPISEMLIRQFFVPQLRNIPSAKFHLLHLCVQHSTIMPPAIFISAFDPLFALYSEYDDSDGHENALNFVNEFDKHREQLMALRQQIREKEPPKNGGIDEEMMMTMKKADEVGPRKEEWIQKNEPIREKKQSKEEGGGDEEGPEEGEIEDDDD